MIYYLKGTLIEKKPPIIVIDVAGIGYEVHASMNTIYNLPETGQSVFIYTHLIIREDAHTLYGFANDHERTLFKTLIKVSGIGPKTAITILSSISPDDFVKAVQANDTAVLVRLPGIGKKTAERLVVEIRDRLEDWQTGFDPRVAKTASYSAEQDAMSALIALGYKPAEAKRAVGLVAAAGEAVSSEEFIRSALKQLMR